MTRFVTVDEKAAVHPAVLWEEAGGKLAVIGRYGNVEDVPGHGDVEVWTFDSPTTMRIGDEANEGRFPMVDADGAPLWEGAAITFRLGSTYINTYAGKGTFAVADRYGGHGFTSEEAFPYWGPGGLSTGSGHVRSNPGGEFVRSGPLKGYHVLKRNLGDPHEHGVVETYVRLDGDPREVCTLTFDPSSSPAP